jgi:hypothetical protein
MSELNPAEPGGPTYDEIQKVGLEEASRRRLFERRLPVDKYALEPKTASSQP